MEPIPSLDIDLRHGPGTPQDAIRRNAQRHQPRLAQNLASLGAVGPYVPRPGPGSQPVIVAGHITRADTTGHHLEQYLAPHKAKPGREQPFFGPAGTVSHTAAQAFAARASTDPHQFRFSVSLKGHPPFLALRPLIEALMHRVQQDLKRPLDWVAQVHTDTPNLHAHVVLRGQDQAGQDLYIRNGYLRHGLTHRAREVATQFLGRTPGVELTREPTRAQTPTTPHVSPEAPDDPEAHPEAWQLEAPEPHADGWVLPDPAPQQARSRGLDR